MHEDLLEHLPDDLTDELDRVWAVPSDSDPMMLYLVLKFMDENKWYCTCKGARFNGSCKHIDSRRSSKGS